MTRAAVVRSALTAVLAGLAVALVVAVAVPRTAPSQAATPAAGAPDVLSGRPAPAPDAAHPRTAPARPEPGGAGRVHLRRSGPLVLGARMADPLGGPEWVVRTFLARRVAGADEHTIGRNRCAQLGRLLDGRFGWIDATNTFRPVRISLTGAPTTFGSRRADLGRRPVLQAFSRITDPSSGAAVPLQGVVWGIAGAAGEPTAGALGLHRGAQGTFLAALPADRAPDVTLTVAYPDGPPATEAVSFAASARRAAAERMALPGGGTTRPAPAAPRVGVAAELDLRVPDPDGGLPWGVAVVPAEGGGWCRTGLARVVGDRVGEVDFRLGTFTDAGPQYGGCPLAGSGPTAAKPADVGWTTGDDTEEEGADPRTGRVARRALPGLTSLSGTVVAGARSVTVATPRDVRTFVPSPRAHAFAVVLDGTFPAGATTITVVRADGTRHTDRLELGF